MNFPRLFSKKLFAVLALAIFCTPQLSAQVKTTVLRGAEVNKTAIINSLMPRPTGVKTRGISLRKSNATGSASLLITFEFSSADLSSQARSELDIVAGALAANELSKFSFSIEGHADPRGDSLYNQYLSQQRAESVVDYLVSMHGIDRQRLMPIGKGDQELFDPSFPAAPENRRVTIKTQVN